jgi:hypothetical protein
MEKSQYGKVSTEGEYTTEKGVCGKWDPKPL